MPKYVCPNCGEDITCGTCQGKKKESFRPEFGLGHDLRDCTECHGTGKKPHTCRKPKSGININTTIKISK
jgi:hypothetical protein